MSRERNWKMRVEDVLVCIGKIKNYTRNMTFEQFSADNKTVDAVIRNFEIIGEAASDTPHALKGGGVFTGKRVNVRVRPVRGSLILIARSNEADPVAMIIAFGKLLIRIFRLIPMFGTG